MASVLDFGRGCGNHTARPPRGRFVDAPDSSGARPGGDMERTEWIQFIIRLSFGRYAFSPEFFEGVRILREIEKWMQTNHILLLPYFNEYGFPRFPSGAVTVSFLAREEAEKAMAFRVLVNELGLSSTLESVRLVNLPEARLTPPRSVPFF